MSDGADGKEGKGRGGKIRQGMAWHDMAYIHVCIPWSE